MSCKKCDALRDKAGELRDRVMCDPDDIEAANARHEMPTNWFDCQCGTHIEAHGDVDCPRCGASYNAFGQRLRNDWRSNPSWGDDEIDDIEGFERSQIAREYA